MAVLNAANEVAVDAFLHHKIGFLDIAKLNEKVLSTANIAAVNELEDVLEADKMARRLALDMVSSGWLL